VHRLPPLPPRPERRPRLFFTSAKTGNGVVDVFQHIAERVLRKWEFDEAVEARRMSVLDEEFDTTIRLGTVDERRGRSWAVKPMCCA
jgi:Ras-related protein Rab-7A